MTHQLALVKQAWVGPRDSSGPMPDGEAGVPASHPSHAV